MVDTAQYGLPPLVATAVPAANYGTLQRVAPAQGGAIGGDYSGDFPCALVASSANLSKDFSAALLKPGEPLRNLAAPTALVPVDIISKRPKPLIETLKPYAGYLGRVAAGAIPAIALVGVGAASALGHIDSDGMPWAAPGAFVGIVGGVLLGAWQNYANTPSFGNRPGAHSRSMMEALAVVGFAAAGIGLGGLGGGWGILGAMVAGGFAFGAVEQARRDRIAK